MQFVSTETFNKPRITKQTLSVYIKKLNNIQLTQSNMLHELRAVAENVLKSNVQLREETDQLRQENSRLKNSTISAQETVISLQNELLVFKDKQLDEVNTAVRSAVQESVKTEIVSYSQAVQKSVQKTPEMVSVKKAVQQVIKEEDCSKNILIFGLIEEANEDTSKAVDGVLECIGTKPKHEAVRIGVKSQSPIKPRPIKVSVRSSAHVLQILRVARNLKDSEKYKHVFISPDRSVEERRIRREVVANLKKRRQDEPDKNHFIRGGKVISSASSGSD